MNISSNTPLYAHSSSPTKTTKYQASEKEHFSIETPDNTKSKEDKVSISTTGADMSDAIDPPLPIGAMPAWWGEFAIRVIFPSERGSPELKALPENEKFSNLSSGESIEYFALLKAHMNNLYECNGLLDENAINKALNSRSTNERLQREFYEGIRADPKMSELVDKLGISLS
ncbi:hypothetical protein HX857_10135 [Pseudomonas gingeri]|uniref:hypothetical protein n=1 Tax=Pseudomonas gingeri TaxID=117681 RepID=UPI0015B9A109|nr:hypothetical protein [Pseudomonas gingeri]NWE69065.1 hypothetical protein [Pseudomonas gingeri]